MAVSKNKLMAVIMTVIMATVLFSFLPSLMELILVGVHNFSDSLSTVATTIGMPTALTTLLGDLDTYFMWGIIASIIGFLLTLAFGLFYFGRKTYRKYRGRSR